MRGLDPARADAWLDAALANVRREYPYAPQLVVEGPDDLVLPRELHPAFYGSYDWHSSVHMHWSIARLLREAPGRVREEDARALLDEHLGAEHLAAEAALVARRPGFERPYGWGWALALHAELDRSEATATHAQGMAPLTEAIVGHWRDYLPRAAYPVRSGVHSSTAFGMLLSLEAARRLGRDDLERALVSHARRFFLHDTDAPLAYEPSGEDFHSPALSEAHLMSLVLDPDDFDRWFDGFLPGIADVIHPALRDPVEPLDDADGRLVHLRGLNLSRAWSWRAVGAALPALDERRVAAYDAADRHLAGALDHVVTGGYMADHWLVSFALLALGGL